MLKKGVKNEEQYLWILWAILSDCSVFRIVVVCSDALLGRILIGMDESNIVDI